TPLRPVSRLVELSSKHVLRDDTPAPAAHASYQHHQQRLAFETFSLDLSLTRFDTTLLAAHRLTMASGYGMHGGVGRCFPFWQEVMACYVINTSAEDDSGKKKCAPVLEDYYECLHHKKEHARALAMQAAYARAETATPRDNAPSARQIRNLGLLGKEEDTKKVLGQS
ncbi:NADH dehydrogenase [ubiquinone] iron-sulfur protein 5-B, partial [Tolypocladium ophioglossoides CBS 100239]